MYVSWYQKDDVVVWMVLTVCRVERGWQRTTWPRAGRGWWSWWRTDMRTSGSTSSATVRRATTLCLLEASYAPSTRCLRYTGQQTLVIQLLRLHSPLSAVLDWFSISSMLQGNIQFLRYLVLNRKDQYGRRSNKLNSLGLRSPQQLFPGGIFLPHRFCVEFLITCSCLNPYFLLSFNLIFFFILNSTKGWMFFFFFQNLNVYLASPK